jgi:pantoate--beta-alanine ligase
MPGMPIPILHTIPEIRAACTGRRVALVPTMGALHEGHAALIRAAATEGAFVVVSVFVNPTQFGPREDFAKYPRTLEADRALSAAAGADAIFAPAAEEMYPAGCLAYAEVPKLDGVLCGPRRPGHFRGVCTVVLKLFNIVQPEVAVFGAKDAQQSIILKTMVKDLNIPVRMRIEPTVREADGLAMSSRNRYLAPEERALAPRIHAALQSVAERVRTGETDVPALERGLNAALAAIPGARIDYAEIRDAETLETLDRLDRPALAAVALVLGTTRLIDNIVLADDPKPT